eukprot:g14302.t1
MMKQYVIEPAEMGCGPPKTVPFVQLPSEQGPFFLDLPLAERNERGLLLEIQLRLPHAAQASGPNLHQEP